MRAAFPQTERAARADCPSRPYKTDESMIVANAGSAAQKEDQIVRNVQNQKSAGDESVAKSERNGTGVKEKTATKRVE